jgi:hypothetical protein
MADNYDWGTFTKRIDIKCSEKDAYDAWATQKGLQKWFLREATFSSPTGASVAGKEHINAGDAYKWHWYGYDDTAVEYGEIVEANGVNFLCFTFCSEAAKTDMQVSVSIKQEQATTIVELKQFNIPTDDRGKSSFHVGCMEGWVFYLANLKSVLEGGVDLRNKNEQLKKMVNS